MKLQNVMKVGDIYHTEFTQPTRYWIETYAEKTYSDQILKEHLYNIGATLEAIEQEETYCPKNVELELKQLQEVLNESECGYLRIVYH